MSVKCFKIDSEEFRFHYLTGLQQLMLLKSASATQILIAIKNLKHYFSDKLFEEVGRF